MREADVIARLQQIAIDPAARGLLDDVALLDNLVITHDSIAQDVHFLDFDPPASVGWKLVAVNLSDLAAKGASPAGALLSLTISGDGSWESEFLTGVAHACESYALPLIGGDTIAVPEQAPRILGLTAIGRAGPRVPDRAGGQPGDRLWLIGSVGDAAAGLAQLLNDRNATGPLVDIYRRPVPLLAAGQELAPHARAMMDVSDGLLLDAKRIAEASGCEVVIDLDAVPLTGAFEAVRGTTLEARLFAVTGGDDYALLAALPPGLDPALTLSLPSELSLACVGTLAGAGSTLSLRFGGRPVPLPERLGYEHHGPIDAPMADRP